MPILLMDEIKRNVAEEASLFENSNTVKGNLNFQGFGKRVEKRSIFFPNNMNVLKKSR